MKLTTKGRYAVTAMLDLALHQASLVDEQIVPVALVDIANRQDISLSYLEQLFAKLRREGLVVSSRGTKGGYRIDKPLADISVARVITAVNEKLDTTKCGGAKNCHGPNSTCLTHDLWTSLGDYIYSYLDKISLADLAADHCDQQDKQATDKVVLFADGDLALSNINADNAKAVS